MASPDQSAQPPADAQASPRPPAPWIGRLVTVLKGVPTTPPATRRQHPVVRAMEARRAQSAQLRLADWITAFAGSMNFVYLHIALFTVWMVFIESKPWPTLTLVVSLEAIFLSTFVMIGQNRQAAFQQAKADHDFLEQELELKTNTDLTREIDRLTTELHSRLLSQAGSSEGPPRNGGSASAPPRVVEMDS
jgi:uncharacterized membrane protein